MKTALLSLLTFALGWFAGSGGRAARWLAPDIVTPQAATTSRAADLPSKSQPASLGTDTKAQAGAPDAFARWEAALKAGKLSDPKLRRALLEEMAATDPERAWRLLMSGAVLVQLADIEALAVAFSKKDGRAAALFGLSIADEYPRSLFLRRALTEWLLEEPSQCLAWLRTQPEQLDLPRYLRITDWGYNTDRFTLPDLEALIALHPENENFAQLAGHILESALRGGASNAEALAWLRRQPASDVRDGMWGRYIKQLAQKGDIRGAASFVGEITDPRMRRQASSEVAANLAGSDPQAALAYAAALPDGDAARYAWRSAFASWAAQKPDEALAYANANLSKLTPELLNSAPSQWADRRPTETLDLASRFPASPARADLIRLVLQVWARRDAPQARMWLDGPQAATALDASDLRALRALLDGRLSQANAGTNSHSTQINDRSVNYLY